MQHNSQITVSARCITLPLPKLFKQMHSLAIKKLSFREFGVRCIAREERSMKANQTCVHQFKYICIYI